MSFMMHTCTHQQTMHQLYNNERKKELIIYAASTHLAHILTKNYDQKSESVMAIEQAVEFNPIVLSDNDYFKISATITLKDNRYHILFIGNCSTGEKTTYQVIISPQKNEYILQKFKRIYTTKFSTSFF